MMTIKKLYLALQQLDQRLQETPVCAVSHVTEVERGQFEGALMLNSKQVIGMALSHEGLFLFTNEEDEGKNNYLAGLPPGFSTGNREIDNRLKGIEPGDEWKSG